LKQINQESESQTQNQESGNQEEGRTELKIHEKPDIPILSETDERRRLGETSKAANDEEVQKLNEVYSPPAAPPQQELPVEGLISRTIWDWKTE